MTIKLDQSIGDCKALSWSDSTVVEQKAVPGYSGKGRTVPGYSGKGRMLQQEIHVTCTVELSASLL